MHLFPYHVVSSNYRSDLNSMIPNEITPTDEPINKNIFHAEQIHVPTCISDK